MYINKDPFNQRKQTIVKWATCMVLDDTIFRNRYDFGIYYFFTFSISSDGRYYFIYVFSEVHLMVI
jgi:hypothetical protein